MKKSHVSGDLPFLVTGATGNVGKQVVHALLDAGEPVRAAVHDDKKRLQLPEGVETINLDFRDPATFEAAVSGVRGIFLLRPPLVVSVENTINKFIDVSVRAGVKSCVFLSVAGIGRNRFIPHNRVENCLKRSALVYTTLRPGFFAQNLTGPYLADIQSGNIVLPAGNGQVTFIDAVDIGAVAALVLQDYAAHAGRSYTLTGSEPFTFTEIAAMLSRALGRRITYEPASILRYWLYSQTRGVPREMAAIITILHVGLRRGKGARVDPTLEQLLGRPARTMQQFINDNLSILQSGEIPDIWTTSEAKAQ